MGVLDFRVELVRSSDKATIIPLTDVLSLEVNKSTEIKNNLCMITLKNSASELADDGSAVIGRHVKKGDQLINFDENDQFKVWSAFLTDASEVGTSWYDDDRLLGSFILKEFNLPLLEDQTRVVVSAIDVAYILFNSIYTFTYGTGNNFTAPGIIRHVSRKFGEAEDTWVTTVSGTDYDVGTSYAIDARFVSEGGTITDYRDSPTTTLSSSISASDTTISLTSSSGFEDAGDATVVIGDEHIAYTGVSGNDLTGCTRGIDDTSPENHSAGTTVYQGFPLVLFSKIWKPVFEWVGELSQTENTNYVSEVTEGGTLEYNRAFLFWVDKDNKVNWVYPNDTVDLTISLGEEGRRNFRLEKSVFDAVNFVIYNCGGDMYGNGILHYYYDETSDVKGLKMRYQPMSKIVDTLVQEDIAVNSTRDTSSTPDILKQFPASYSPPIVPSFLDDANKFRATLNDSARTNVTSDSEYNSALREACKWRGLVEAKKITVSRSGLRYRGSIVLKGVYVNPGDLISVTNPYSGLLSQTLRVLNVRHRIDGRGWETSLDVQEDEKTKGVPA